ncbi:MAG: AAA family ATPase [Lachnospiraceae bacterium]|nr:AAA family ATPase [Lachnospiraceae bacterium]
MKILHIRIENFGTISDLDLDLKDGYNCVLQKNGWGKSTLAAFIRTMFYGLEGARKKDLYENDRMRYQPWNKGHFGGEIVFESNEKTYTLIRDFGTKEADVTFELFDAVTGLPSTDYTKNIGTEIFGIDSESFRRTGFIDHNLIHYEGVNSTISSKVSALSQTNDLNNYDRVEEQIKNYLNANSPKKKNGGLYLLNEQIHALKEETKKRKPLEEQLNFVRDKRSAEKKEEAGLKTLREDLQKEQKKLGDLKSSAAAMQAVKRLHEETAARYEKLDKYFKGNVPTEDEVKKIQDDCVSVRDLLKENEDDIPEIESKRKAVDSLNTSVEELRKEKEEKEAKKAKQLLEIQKKKDEVELAKARFAKEKEAYEEEVKAYKQRQKKYEEEVARINELRANVVVKKKPSVGMLIAGVIVILVGILLAVVCLMNHYATILLAGAAVLVILGIVLLILTFLSAKPEHVDLPEYPKAPSGEMPAPPVIPEVLQSQPVLEMPEDTAHYEEDIRKLKENIEKCQDEIKALQAKDRENEEKIASLERGIREFLSKYELSYSRSDVSDVLSEMKGRISEFKEVRKQKISQEEEIERHKGTDDTPTDVVSLEEKLSELMGRLQTVNEKLDEKALIISQYDRTIENTVQQIEELDTYKDRLEEKEEAYEEAKKRYDLVARTGEYLSKSKDSFIARFMSPIKDSFEKYYALMASCDAEIGEFRVDAEMNFHKKEEGAYHEIHTQSEGYSDMIGICIRFALLDVMYKDERPMVIMDDPFVNLDAGHLLGAKEFLKEVSKEYQILYFTCHEDRV